MTSGHVYGSTKPTVVTHHPSTAEEVSQWYFYNFEGNVAGVMIKGADVAQRVNWLDDYVDDRFVGKVTNAEGHEITLDYDSRHGKPDTITDANGLTTLVGYDEVGRVAVVDYPDSNELTIEYFDCTSCSAINGQALGYKVEISQLGGPDQEVYHDVLGRPIRQRVVNLEGDWVNTDTVYDDRGNVAKKSVPYLSTGTPIWTEYAYDLQNRIDYVDSAGGDDRDVEYAIVSGALEVSEAVTVTNPGGTQNHIRRYNSLGQLILAKDGSPQVQTEYDYDSNGWLDWVKVDQNVATITTMAYDRAGNRTSITEPNTGTTTFNFNALGELKTQTDAENRVITWDYDLLGRLTARNDDGVPNSWSYDPLNGIGKLASRSTIDFEENYYYDALSRVESILTDIDYSEGTTSFELEQDYDVYGRPTDTTLPSGFVKKNQYNSYGYMNKVLNGSQQVLHEVTNVSSYGLPTTETFINGTTKTTGYEAATGRVSSIQQTSLANLGFVWRAHGQLYQRSKGSTTETFGYDGLNRVASATTTSRTLSYDYDDLGNLEEILSTVGSDADTDNFNYDGGTAGPHGLYQSYYGGVLHTFVYDNVGNVTNINATSGNTTFQYDASNRATSIVRGSDSLSFKYDPDGQRFYKYSSDGATHTFYLYGATYQETRLGAALTGYRKLQVTDVVQHTKDPAGTEEYLFFRRDHLGSIDAILDASGDEVATFGYDPYGQRRKADWSGDITQSEVATILSEENEWTKRGFTDHEHLDRVDIVHMNGRIFDARFGRFLNADPVVSNPAYSQSFNRYTYVSGSPLSFVDPSGYEECATGEQDFGGSCDSHKHEPGSIGDKVHRLYELGNI